MRRRGPRPIGEALRQLGHETTPPTVLARIQAVWSDVVGGAIAAEAQPVAERAGTVTVACRSATWASELELLAPDLLEKLNGALADGGGAQLTELRAKVAKIP